MADNNKVSPFKIQYILTHTSLGLMLLAATERGICLIQFGENQETLLASLQKTYPQAKIQAASGAQEPWRDWIKLIENYLQGKADLATLPLDLHGTEFQTKVWQYLQNIPPGKTLSYLQVAEALGSPQSVRAVARACATNNIALAIPCHRVVRSDGKLAGYRWGLERKLMLLQKERSYA